MIHFYIPSLLEANRRDFQVGSIVRCKPIPSFNLNTPSIGVVYELYDDFDQPNKKAISIIFETGAHDGFSLKDIELFDVSAIGVIHSVTSYKFKNVTELYNDWQNGFFWFRLIKKKDWFYSRIGKTVMRTGPDNESVSIVINDVTQADYLYDVSNEMGLIYIDKETGEKSDQFKDLKF